MKRGAEIKVSEFASYNGQDMDWTETYTGEKQIKKGGEWVFHRSSAEIKEFRAKDICVSPFEHGKSYLESTAKLKEVKSKFNSKSFIYAIFLPEGTTVDTYSDDEYRFSLDGSVKIIFLGTIVEAKGESVVSFDNRRVDTYIQYSNCVDPLKLKSIKDITK